MYFTNFHSDLGSFQGSFWHLISLIGAQMNGSKCGCTLWSVVFSVPVVWVPSTRHKASSVMFSTSWYYSLGPWLALQSHFTVAFKDCLRQMDRLQLFLACYILYLSPGCPLILSLKSCCLVFTSEVPWAT